MAALIAILLGDTVTSKHVIRIFEAKTLVVAPFRVEPRAIAYSLLPADWKTLWRYQHVSTGMLDDNGWGLMFEILSPFAQRKRWNRVNGFKFFLPFPFFRLSSIPFTRMDKTRIRSFFVSLERRRLCDTLNHPP